MPAQWLSNSSEVSARASAFLASAASALGQPDQLRRLRRVLIGLLLLWAVLALVRLVWALLPTAGEAAPLPDKVVNPITVSSSGTAADPVDIEAMRGWHLFGEAGAEPAPEVAPPPEATASAREGIEEGARETRLNLKLRGAVATTEDGLGYAIIESKSKQEVYAVDDELPLPGRVLLAKVLAKQVVLDNGGTYELLTLFDEAELPGVAPAPAAPRTAPGQSGQIDKRGDEDVTALAQSYRERLYNNPQSLAKVVNVTAVREGGALRGYRVRPGQDAAQFEQLGFQEGDLVTSVNGISLDDPSNTMRLYSALRSAGEVDFELERAGQPVTISVSLEGGAQ